MKGNIFPFLLFILIIPISMGLFSFFKKSASPAQGPTGTNPYRDSATNYMYNLLFCDDINLYKEKTQHPNNYPFNVLFAEPVDIAALQKVINDKETDPRVRILAYNAQLKAGHQPAGRELLAVIVEVGLDGGLDVLASFPNGTARYINHTEKMIIWETMDDATANTITHDLFASSRQTLQQIGLWDKPRRPAPTKGNARITFLVSDGICFGEAPVDVLFSDPIAREALAKATELMQYLMKKSLEKNK